MWFIQFLVCARPFDLDKDKWIFRMKVWIWWILGSTTSHEGHWQQDPDLPTTTSSVSGLILRYTFATVRNQCLVDTWVSLPRLAPPLFSRSPSTPCPLIPTIYPTEDNKAKGNFQGKKVEALFETNLIGFSDTCKTNSAFWDSSISMLWGDKLTDQAHNKNTWYTRRSSYYDPTLYWDEKTKFCSYNIF